MKLLPRSSDWGLGASASRPLQIKGHLLSLKIARKSPTLQPIVNGTFWHRAVVVAFRCLNFRPSIRPLCYRLWYSQTVTTRAAGDNMFSFLILASSSIDPLFAHSCSSCTRALVCAAAAVHRCKFLVSRAHHHVDSHCHCCLHHALR
jgi:hypothetical protein